MGQGPTPTSLSRAELTPRVSAGPGGEVEAMPCSPPGMHGSGCLCRPSGHTILMLDVRGGSGSLQVKLY